MSPCLNRRLKRWFRRWFRRWFKRPSGESRLFHGLYTAAAVAGILLATFGVIEGHAPGGETFGSAEVARVDDARITLRRYREVLSDMATDSREPLDAAGRAFALERLIDEELLILRARELGLDQRVQGIRKAMSSAVIAQIVAEAMSEVPSDDALRDLYRSDRAFFLPPTRYRVRWFRLPGLGDRDETQAKRIRARLEGGDFADVRRVGELPHEPLPASTLATYLGDSLTGMLQALEPGTYSAPVWVRGGWHILELSERVEPGAPDFAELAPAVRTEYLRRRSDRALVEYLDWLRARADVRINHELVGLDRP